MNIVSYPNKIKKTDVILDTGETSRLRSAIAPSLGIVARRNFMNDADYQRDWRDGQAESDVTEPTHDISVSIPTKELPEIAARVRKDARGLRSAAELVDHVTLGTQRDIQTADFLDNLANQLAPVEAAPAPVAVR